MNSAQAKLVRAYLRRQEAFHDATEGEPPEAITAAETPIPIMLDANPRRSGAYVREELVALAEVVQLQRRCFK